MKNIDEFVKTLINGNTIDDYINQLNARMHIKCNKKELDVFMRSQNMRLNTKFNNLLDRTKLLKLIYNLDDNFDEEKILKIDYLCCLWKENKTIYELDDEFVKTLIDTEINKIPTQIFDYLPYDQILVKFKLYENITAILLDVNKKFGFITVSAIYMNKYNDSMKSDFYTVSYNSKNEYCNTIDFIPDKVINKIVYNFIMYISQPHPGDIERSNNNNIYIKDNISIKINKWNVGFRYGNTIRKLKSENKDINKITINQYKKHCSPKPHIRKAHWHTYKVGRGRKKIIVKWVAPILVNTNTSDDIITTIHKVK